MEGKGWFPFPLFYRASPLKSRVNVRDSEVVAIPDTSAITSLLFVFIPAEKSSPLSAITKVAFVVNLRARIPVLIFVPPYEEDGFILNPIGQSIVMLYPEAPAVTVAPINIE